MSAFAGTGTLLRMALRRDRIMLSAWIAAFVLAGVFLLAALIFLVRR